MLSGDTENPACGTTKVTIRSDDPKFKNLAEIYRELQTKNEWAFIGWGSHREYTFDELASAQVFRLFFSNHYVAPAGEQCGTIYDQSHVCSLCGVGEEQVSTLCLYESKLPKGRDIATTLADEWIASTKFTEMCIDNAITGIEFAPILSSKKDRESKNWRQIVSNSSPLSICEPTQTGIHPFDADEKSEFRCPLGHVIGLNILSEIHIEQPNFNISDWNITLQRTGHRRGLLRPKPSILISPKLRALMLKEKIKGFKTEVAYTVPDRSMRVEPS